MAEMDYSKNSPFSAREGEWLNDVSGFAMHTLRAADIRRAKGGSIGTNGKGVVAWRIDHQLEQHRLTTWPILRDRGMPAGLGVVTDAVGDASYAPDPTATTWDQLRTMHWEGNEIWSHSRTHLDPAPNGGLTVKEEIANSREILIAQNLPPVGWQMPGISGVQTADYSGNFTTVEQFASRNGQLFLANYGLIEIDRGSQGARRILPTNGCYGLGHFTIDGVTLAQAKAQVDLAINYGMGIELMFHPRFLGTSGMMSISDFTLLADYVKDARDAGSIEVLTPSGLAFADPGSTRRVNLLRHGTFEGVVQAGNVYGAWTSNTATSITIQTSGGFEGSNFARFATAAGANYLYQPYTLIGEGNLSSQAFVVEAYVRNASASPSIARIQLVDNGGNTPTFSRDVKVSLTAGQGWTKIRLPFCIPNTCFNLHTRLSRFTTGADGMTGDVDFDMVSLMPI